MSVEEEAIGPRHTFAGFTSWARSSVFIFTVVVAAGCSSTRVAENLLRPPDHAVYGAGATRPALVPRNPNGFAAVTSTAAGKARASALGTMRPSAWPPWAVM